MPLHKISSWGVKSEEQDLIDTLYLGVDPGASGGIAALKIVGQPEAKRAIVHSLHPMPKDDSAILEILRGYATRYRVYAVVEAVTGYVASKNNDGASGGDTLGAKGGGRANSQNSFTFGQSFGALKMALCATGIPYHLVAAKTWQNGLSISPRKRTEGKGQWKNRLKSVASMMFPGKLGKSVITLKTCDALLMAEYARRTWHEERMEERK